MLVSVLSSAWFRSDESGREVHLLRETQFTGKARQNP